MAGTITGHKHLLSPLSVCYNHRALLCSCMQVNSFIGYSQTDLEVQKDCCLCDSEAACFFFNSETKLLISLTWQNRSSFGFVCDPKPCLHMFTSFPFLCLWSCWRSSQTRYISPHGFGCHICGFTSLLHLQDRVWGMRDDLWSGNPPPLPIPPHPSHSSLTHVQAHPVRCSWSVSSSLLQQSVNKLSLSSPLHIPTPSFCFCRSYQFNLSSRNSSFSLSCWFVWHAVSRPGECCSNTL